MLWTVCVVKEQNVQVSFHSNGYHTIILNILKHEYNLIEYLPFTFGRQSH